MRFVGYVFCKTNALMIPAQTYPATSLPSPRLSLCEPMNSPRLEVSEVDVVPFSVCAHLLLFSFPYLCTAFLA